MHFVYAKIVHVRGNQLVPQLLLKQSETWLHNIDTFIICGKKFDAKILIFDKMIALGT